MKSCVYRTMNTWTENRKQTFSFLIFLPPRRSSSHSHTLSGWLSSGVHERLRTRFGLQQLCSVSGSKGGGENSSSSSSAWTCFCLLVSPGFCGHLNLIFNEWHISQCNDEERSLEYGWITHLCNDGLDRNVEPQKHSHIISYRVSVHGSWVLIRMLKILKSAINLQIRHTGICHMTLICLV